MKKKDSSLPHPLETFYIWGNHRLSQIENKHSDLLGSTIQGFQLSLYKMGITMVVPLLTLEGQRDLNEIMEVKTFEHLIPKLSEHLLPKALETS